MANGIKRRQKRIITAKYSKNISDIDSDLPIKLDDFDIILNNLHEHYSTLIKSDIAIIIKTTFEVIRKQIVNSEMINIKNFLPGMRLVPYYKVRNNLIVINTRVRVSTPKHLK